MGDIDYPVYRACPVDLECGGYYVTDVHTEPIEFLAQHLIGRHPDACTRMAVLSNVVEEKP